MTGNRRLVVALFLTTVLAIALTSGAGLAIEDPELSAFVASPNLQPGETVELTVQLVNEDRHGGDEVAPAENLRATLESGEAPIDVRSGTIVVGDIEDGGEAEVTFTVRVPRDAEPGEYELPVELEYIADDELLDRTRFLDVRIERAARFEVVSAETNAIVGDRGAFAVLLRNNGSAAARDATVTLASEDPALTFAGGSLAESYVGRWESGEEIRLDVPVDVSEGATVRPVAIQATVDYEDPDGEERSRNFPVSVVPSGDPAFAVDVVGADLRVGGRGAIRASVENAGETVARDATVRLVAPWSNLTTPIEYPVGDLGPRESAQVRFTLEVPAGINPGPQRVTLLVEHATTAGERRLSDPLGASVGLGPRRSPVAVEPVNATFETDSAGELDLRLTNRAGGEITDLRAVLTATDPFSSDDPAAYVPRLGPGESTTVGFHLDVSEDAVQGNRPVSVSLAYDDASGNRRGVEDVPVGVTVVEPTGSDVPVAAVAAIVLVLVAGAVWWYRRR